MRARVKPVKAAVAEITRSKLLPTPGRNYRLAWKWLYHVSLDGAEPVAVDTLLKVARNWARARAVKVVESW